MLALGCAHLPRTAELSNWDGESGYRFHNLANEQNTDSLFVILAFSGGGTRAAALAYGTLEALRDTSIVWDGESKSLLSEVDVISSVSGGSFTALYYGLHGEAIFDSFPDRFLYAPVQRNLFMRLSLPWNWFRLATPAFDRIHLAAEYYDRSVFDDATYQQLVDQSDRPYIIVNATDMALGSRFEFTQDQFDYLCVDLAKLPVARAAAASSAFPGLLSPMTLRSRGQKCGARPPEWFDEALEDRQINPAREVRARTIDHYLTLGRGYVHLIDGGVSDNIGLRAPIEALTSNDSPWSLLDAINNRRVRTVLTITVNAKTGVPKRWGEKKNAPKLLKVMKASGTTPMSHYSFEVIDKVREEARNRAQLQETVTSCVAMANAECPGAIAMPDFQLVDYHTVEITFANLDDPEETAFFLALPTTFQLERETVDQLRSVARRLLQESVGFQDFLASTNTQP